MKWLTAVALAWIAASTHTAMCAEIPSRPHVHGVIRDGVAFVPMRAIFEFLGAEVEYEHGVIKAVLPNTIERSTAVGPGVTSTYTKMTRGHACRLTVGSREAEVDGTRRTLFRLSLLAT